MIVCICRVVSDRQIKSLVAGGARSVAEVTASCGAGGGCGACRQQIAQMVSACHGNCSDCPNRKAEVASVYLPVSEAEAA